MAETVDALLMETCMTTAEAAKKPRPVHTERIGLVSVSIWAQTTENRTFYTTTLERRYKEKDGYKSTDSLNHDDLLNARKLLERAEEWIAAKIGEDRTSAAA
jgi:hypothetical protein